MENQGYIFDIKRFAVHDGPGIRTTVFLKGCPLRCWWCHNPEGISQKNDLMFFNFKCIQCKTCLHVCPYEAISFDNSQRIVREKCVNCGLCSEYCPTEALRSVGTRVSVDELMSQIERDVLLYDNSNGGVTFSGGEPLLQHVFLKQILQECKKRDIHTVLDTSGYASKEVLFSVLEYVDMFLFDLKLADEAEHKIYTGVSNKIIKDNLRMLVDLGRGKDVILRLPVIPGITDTEKNIDGLVKLVSELKGINEIDLLPFHDISEKYNRLDMKYKMTVRQAPEQEKLKQIKQKFQKAGLYVKI